MSLQKPTVWLLLERTVRFGDTDAAGVMHFHQLLRWCHEAWEESLECYGINACEIFPGHSHNEPSLAVALPIIHCEADFTNPIQTGDKLIVEIQPKRLSESSFQVSNQFILDNKNVAKGILHHMAINSETRKRCELPGKINQWIDASMA